MRTANSPQQLKSRVATWFSPWVWRCICVNISQMPSYSSCADMGDRRSNAPAGDVPLGRSQSRDWDRWLLGLPVQRARPMGLVFEFAKSRSGGYIVTSTPGLVFSAISYPADPLDKAVPP